MKFTCLLALVVSLNPSFAATNAPADRVIVPLDREFSTAAAALEKSGSNFDQIFAHLCRQALGQAAANPKLRLDDCARSMFGGLWQWANSTGNPKLQDRKDWAQHFIGGGTFEGYLDAGPRAAVTKEKIDARNSDNRYDLDDLAATMLGSRWMDIATTGGLEHTKRWLELWATGKLTLSRSLPKLELGQMPQFQEAQPERVEKVRAFVNAALQPPPP